jgi:DNA modification methylase
MDKTEKILLGDCLEVLKTLPDNSVDSVVTDPPYGLSFMGKKWDYDVPGEDIWRECLRVLKPGGHLLAFAGTRTQHRMAVRIEDAGFEIRDMIAWVYGSGFPKSLNIGKAVDKLQGNEREVVDNVSADGRNRGAEPSKGRVHNPSGMVTMWERNSKTTKGQSDFEGFGTALKPALEPITVARKPLTGTVAENVLKWGTGGLNIDGCRVEYGNETDNRIGTDATNEGRAKNNFFKGVDAGNPNYLMYKPTGRFPANFIHDGSDEVLELMPETQSGALNFGHKRGSGVTSYGGGGGIVQSDYGNDKGSAARFFYCAKASKSERDAGLEGMELKQTVGGGGGIGDYLEDINSSSGKYGCEKAPAKNYHPTVKPIALMRYLIRLVTPPGGVVLDPFAGSGTTGCAAALEQMSYILIEREPDYIEIAAARIRHAGKQPKINFSMTNCKP